MADVKHESFSSENEVIAEYDEKLIAENLPALTILKDRDRELVERSQKTLLTHFKYIVQNIGTEAIDKLRLKIWTKEEFEYIINSDIFRTFYSEERLSFIFRRLLKPFDFDGEKLTGKTDSKLKAKKIHGEKPKFIICSLCPDPEETDEIDKEFQTPDLVSKNSKDTNETAKETSDTICPDSGESNNTGEIAPSLIRLEFSALSKQMAAVDEAYFETSKSNEALEDGAFTEKTHSLLDILYKPYFYQVSIDFPKDKLPEKLSANYYYLIPVYNLDRLKKATGATATELIAELTAKTESETETEPTVGTELTAEPTAETESAKEFYCGRIAYAGSPLVYQNILVDWTNAIISDDSNFDEILKEYVGNNFSLKPLTTNYPITETDEQVIENVFNQTFNDTIDKLSLRVYRVGQANFIIGSISTNKSQKKTFAFDLGYSTDSFFKFKSNHPLTEADLGIYDTNVLPESASNLELVMISHWHQDHYKATFTFSRDFFRGRTKWIAPFHEYQSPDSTVDYTENRLIAYLIKQKCILFVPSKYTGYQNGNYILCRGIDPANTNLKPTKGTLNSTSLILRLNKTLLPGDCACKFWPDILKNSSSNSSALEYIIIPHHGSETDKDDLTTILNALYTGTKENAYVCVSKVSKDNLPVDDIIEKYEGLGFTIVKTCEGTDEIKIHDK